MTDRGRLIWLVAGLLLGGVGTVLCVRELPQARAGDSRHEDYVLCTGPVNINPRLPTDGVWLLDYRAGKLLGTVIDRNLGKIVGWAEVDLVREFNVPPRQNVHFVMTTGVISKNQSALYVAETTTGKLAVYSMGSRVDGRPGVQIKRHDLVLFRRAPGDG
jgi:hypothetical protein